TDWRRAIVAWRLVVLGGGHGSGAKKRRHRLRNQYLMALKYVHGLSWDKIAHLTTLSASTIRDAVHDEAKLERTDPALIVTPLRLPGCLRRRGHHARLPARRVLELCDAVRIQWLPSCSRSHRRAPSSSPSKPRAESRNRRRRRRRSDTGLRPASSGDTSPV